MRSLYIGDRREVFWDHTLIEPSRTTATLTLHKPRIEEIVFVHDAPWEGDGCNSYSIIRIDGVYRAYYLAWKMMNEDCTAHIVGNEHFVCCIESADGIHWTRPNLGLCEFRGSKDNNIVLNFTNSEFDDMVHIFIDENPDCPAEERIKAIGHDRQKALSCYVSADGLHFQKCREMTKLGKFDTHNIAFWSHEHQSYFAYIRDFHSRKKGGDWNSAIRDVRVMTSADFRHWTVPEQIDFDGAEDYPLYTNEVQPYPRAPHVFIGFPSRYMERKEWTENVAQLPNAVRREKLCRVHPRYGLTVTDTVFMSSRDGKSFHRFDEAFIRPGIEQGFNWVYGDCYPATGLVETASALKYAPDEYSLYCYEKHWSGEPAELRRYTIRKDGFASFSASYGERKIYTRPFIFDGNRMELNFSTSARGYVFIKLHSTDETLSSCELFGDSIDRLVPFDGDLSLLAGKEVTMEITLRDADLFSFRFFDSQSVKA
jgi:hypothetical protein